jgi:hypothetical protein
VVATHPQLEDAQTGLSLTHTHGNTNLVDIVGTTTMAEPLAHASSSNGGAPLHLSKARRVYRNRNGSIRKAFVPKAQIPLSPEHRLLTTRFYGCIIASGTQIPAIDSRSYRDQQLLPILTTFAMSVPRTWFLGRRPYMVRSSHPNSLHVKRGLTIQAPRLPAVL